MSPRCTSKSTLPEPSMFFGGRFAGAEDCHWHTHPTIEFVLVTEGDCSCSLSKMTMDGEPGVLWVLPADVPHYQRNVTYTKTIYVGTRIDRRHFDLTPRGIHVGIDGYARRWMEDMIDLQRDESDGQHIADSLVAALLGELKRIEAQHGKAVRLHPAVREAIELMERHVTKRLDIPALADLVYLSPSHLTTLFRQVTGMPPLQYQQRLRLRRAEQMLRDPHMTVKQVSIACGYEDCGYFVRLFRQHYGTPPGQWRVKH